MENRTLIKDAFSKKGVVEIAGWVQLVRDLSKVKFVVLRDISGVIQVTGVNGKTPEKVFKDMEKISRESVIYVKGTIKDSKQAPGGKEINPDEIKIISVAEDLPIDVSEHSKTELPKRLDYRFLDFHRQRIQAIFKIQNEITNSFREFFYKKGFLEMQPPCIISSSSEGGTDLFSVSYFEKKAFLAQSPQLYKQMIACSMEKTFMITPVWRAEKHNTTRHINEIRQLDIEMAFANQEDVMKQLEDVLTHIIQNVMDKCKESLELLEVKLKLPKSKYLSYDETVKLLGIKYGEDLSPEDERNLDKKFP
ncbi:MAG: amino acid--tRNA ligase-related protein, partial [Nanoarchaeota archaeon]